MLFRIPRRSIINVETSALRAKLPALFSDEGISHGKADDDDPSSSQLDSWSALILVLLYEHLLGAASAWRPYLDVLPESFATPMFWTPAELAELQTSATVSKIGREGAENMFRGILLPAVRAHADVFQGSAALSDEQLVQLAHRMGSTIMAYAFDLENDEDRDEDEEDGWVEDRDGKAMMGMVPMADILNADAEFNVCPGAVRIEYMTEVLISSRHTSTTATTSSPSPPSAPSRPARRFSTTTARTPTRSSSAATAT